MWKISQVILIVSAVYAVGFCGLSPAETWAINALSLQPLPSSHPVPAPQVRSQALYKCMYTTQRRGLAQARKNSSDHKSVPCKLRECFEAVLLLT